MQPSRSNTPANPDLPERRLLLLAASAHAPHERQALVRAACATVTDWRPVLDAAAGHGVAPLLAWAVRDPDMMDALSPEVRTELTDLARGAVASTLMHQEVLQRLLATFAAQGIETLVWKGPVVASLYESEYQAPGLRDYGDLDLLVRPSDVDRAASALKAAGFQQLYADTPAQARLIRRTQQELVFARGTQHVDLHWCIAKQIFAVPFDVGGLFDRRRTVQVAGRSVPTFGLDDTVLSLCIHGSLHAYQRLIWVADIARYLHPDSAVNWARLLRTADAGGYGRMVLVSLLLAHRLLGASIPGSIEQRVRDDAAVGQMADLAEAGLFDRGGEHEAFRRFHFALHDGAMARLRFALRAAFTPAVADWEWLSLPAAAWPLYYLVRPLRLALKYGRRGAA